MTPLESLEPEVMLQIVASPIIVIVMTLEVSLMPLVLSFMLLENIYSTFIV
jgi:hypothetical protein